MIWIIRPTLWFLAIRYTHATSQWLLVNLKLYILFSVCAHKITFINGYACNDRIDDFRTMKCSQFQKRNTKNSFEIHLNHKNDSTLDDSQIFFFNFVHWKYSIHWFYYTKWIREWILEWMNEFYPELRGKTHAIEILKMHFHLKKTGFIEIHCYENWLQLVSVECAH